VKINFCDSVDKFSSNLCFRGDEAMSSAPLSAPIEAVNKIIEKPLDILIEKPVDEKSRKKRKKAITVTSSIIVLSGLVALLNPKFSGKTLVKVQKLYHEAAEKLAKNKDNKTLKFTTKVYEKMMQGLEFTNNFNSAKDVWFKRLCLEEKSFLNVKNKTCRNVLQKLDSAFRFVVTKPYNAITKGFDNIGKKTVVRKYNNLNKELDKLELLINKHKANLSPEDSKKVEKLLIEISEHRKYFSKTSLDERLLAQENLMQNLERDFIKQYRSYVKGFTNLGTDKTEHFSKNFSFWAQDIMMPARNKLESNGQQAISKLFNVEGKKGAYTEILEILSPHLDDTGCKLFKNVENRMKKANFTECVEYFDKKRDLVLGGAPTDIVTALGGIALSGVAISTADNKDERISRLITSGFPVIAGLGTSLALTGMLFSGIKGLAIGGLTGLGFNFVGEKVDDIRLAAKHKTIIKNDLESKKAFKETDNA